MGARRRVRHSAERSEEGQELKACKAHKQFKDTRVSNSRLVGRTPRPAPMERDV